MKARMQEPEAAAPALDGCQASIDWLELSIKHTTPFVLLMIMRRHLGVAFGREAMAVLRDDDAKYDATGPLNVRVRADRIGQENRRGEREPWAGCRLPGAACRVIGTKRLLAFLDSLRHLKHPVKVSRLDLALDDFTRSLTPRQFALMCVDGDLSSERALLSERAVTRVKSQNWDWSRRMQGAFWLGGTKSDRLLRVYDKEAESKGTVPSVRFELQNRDDYATDLAKKLLTARKQGRKLVEVFMAHLLAFVDLREPRGARSRSNEWPRLPLWQEFVGRARAAATAKPNDSDVEAWERASIRQTRGFLAVQLRASGIDEEEYRVMVTSRTTPAAAALKRILGPELPRLSPEHAQRLRQLKTTRTAGS